MSKAANLASYASKLTGTGNVTSSNVTGNVTAGNATITGGMTITGNVTAGNVIVSNVFYPNGTVFSGGGGGSLQPVVQATGGMFVNNTTITANYTVVANTNAFSVGPITTANGVNVTIASGSRWVII